MRNGQYDSKSFVIGISRLDSSEKLRLVAVLDSKLGLKSKLTMGGKKLAISNPDRVVEHIKPYFHSSQLSRLESKVH
jgi:hypothetical protein